MIRTRDKMVQDISNGHQRSIISAEHKRQIERRAQREIRILERNAAKSEQPIRWESLNRQATGTPPSADTIKKKLAHSLFFRGCYGIGDNLGQRLLIKHLAKQHETIYLKTTIPELYWDIDNVKFIYPDDVNDGMGHRTPAKHIENLPKTFFVEKLAGIKEMRWCHKLQHIEQTIERGLDGSVKRFIEQQDGSNEEADPSVPDIDIFEDIRIRSGIPIDEFDFMFPVKREWITAAKKIVDKFDLQGKKLCIIRPPTIRVEWPCSSRNPKIEYYQLLIDKYKDKYFFVSIADLEEGKEWLDGNLSGIDVEFHKGEIPLMVLFGLLKISDMIITNPTWMMLVGIATRAKTFCIFGGHAGPEFLFNKQMGLDNFAYVAPEPFCNCWKMKHECNKEIPKEKIITTFEEFLSRPKWLNTKTVGFPPGIGDVHWPLLIMESFKERHGIDRLVVKFFEQWDYTSQFLKNIPFIDEVQKLDKALPFSMNLAGGHGQPLYIGKGGLDYMFEYGSQLEQGVPFEEILPQYLPNWNYEIRGLDLYDEDVENLREQAGGRLALIYTASKGGNHHWARNDWTPNDWMELIRLFHQANNCKVVMIGARFDKDYTNELKRLDKAGLIIDLTGETPIMKTLAIIKGADLFIGFPCGLEIMACHFRIPCAKFWPIRGISQGGVYSPGFMHSWLPPWSRNSDTYLAIPYGAQGSDPRTIFERLKKFL